mgnify:FL=1|tara:strand:- start:11235 stop:11417 length:183 start_codon:yes stop_codon:yes gene_type:complete
MTIGDNILGIAVHRFEEIQADVIYIGLYPFKIILEHLKEEKCYQISLGIFSFKFGIFLNY